MKRMDIDLFMLFIALLVSCHLPVSNDKWTVLFCCVLRFLYAKSYNLLVKKYWAIMHVINMYNIIICLLIILKLSEEYSFEIIYTPFALVTALICFNNRQRYAVFYNNTPNGVFGAFLFEKFNRRSSIFFHNTIPATIPEVDKLVFIDFVPTSLEMSQLCATCNDYIIYMHNRDVSISQYINLDGLLRDEQNTSLTIWKHLGSNRKNKSRCLDYIGEPLLNEDSQNTETNALKRKIKFLFESFNGNYKLDRQVYLEFKSLLKY